MGLGTYMAFDVQGNVSERKSAGAVLRRFVDREGMLADTSPMYGSAESVLGDLAAEQNLRGRLFLATKVWTTGRAAGIAQMETSLARLRASAVDLMQVHNLQDLDTHLPTLREWKQQGRIRYIGITHYQAGAFAELERLLLTRQFDFVQFNYSIAEREAESRLLQAAQDCAVAVIVNRPFAQGALFSRVRGKPLPAWAADFACRSWGQFFLQYIIAHPAVTCVIPATRNEQHLDDNMTAAAGALPSQSQRQAMADFFDRL